MYDESNPKDEQLTIYADGGYKEVQKDLSGANVIMPYKKSRKRKGEKFRKLAVEQTKHNKKVGSIRVSREQHRQDKAAFQDDSRIMALRVSKKMEYFESLSNYIKYYNEERLFFTFDKYETTRCILQDRPQMRSGKAT